MTDTRDAYLGTDGQVHKRFRMGPRDTSPTVVAYPLRDRTRSYHPRCYGCWNGNSHSEAYHDEHAKGDW